MINNNNNKTRILSMSHPIQALTLQCCHPFLQPCWRDVPSLPVCTLFVSLKPLKCSFHSSRRLFINNKPQKMEKKQTWIILPFFSPFCAEHQSSGLWISMYVVTVDFFLDFGELWRHKGHRCIAPRLVTTGCWFGLLPNMWKVQQSFIFLSERKKKVTKLQIYERLRMKTDCSASSHHTVSILRKISPMCWNVATPKCSTTC